MRSARDWFRSFRPTGKGKTGKGLEDLGKLVAAEYRARLHGIAGQQRSPEGHVPDAGDDSVLRLVAGGHGALDAVGRPRLAGSEKAAGMA